MSEAGIDDEPEVLSSQLYVVPAVFLDSDNGPRPPSPLFLQAVACLAELLVPALNDNGVGVSGAVGKD